MKLSLLVPICSLATALPSLAQVTVDGTIAGDPYGPAVSVQAVQTGFGDNFSELNAAYVHIEGGRLYLAVTGNLEDNFNKLEIFIDSVGGGENVFSGVPGNDNTGSMTGLTFDAGFEADYFVIARRGSFMGDKFDVDIAALGTPNFSSFIDVFGGVNLGSGSTGTGPANASPIEVAMDNSNLMGIGTGFGMADQAAAAAVQTGFEMSVDLGDIGAPTGDIKFCIFVNGSNHDFASNQFLGPFQPDQDNLGSDGMGNFIAATCVFDLNTFAGDQFFTAAAQTIGTNYCTSVPNSSGNSATMSAGGQVSIAGQELSLTASGLPSGVSGIIYYGTGQTFTPFGDGFRCVGGALQRLPFNQANANGVLGEPDVFALNMPNVPLTAGTFNFQGWFRDPGAMATGFNLTDGLTIVFVP